MKTFTVKYLITFAVVFVVTAIISFLYNLIFHNFYDFEIETAFRLAIILAVVFPLMNVINKKRN